jgi:hypothetical protein
MKIVVKEESLEVAEVFKMFEDTCFRFMWLICRFCI